MANVYVDAAALASGFIGTHWDINITETDKVYYKPQFYLNALGYKSGLARQGRKLPGRFIGTHWDINAARTYTMRAAA